MQRREYTAGALLRGAFTGRDNDAALQAALGSLHTPPHCHAELSEASKLVPDQNTAKPPNTPSNSPHPGKTLFPPGQMMSPPSPGVAGEAPFLFPRTGGKEGAAVQAKAATEPETLLSAASLDSSLMLRMTGLGVPVPLRSAFQHSV